jgi:hypothetical protein
MMQHLRYLIVVDTLIMGPENHIVERSEEGYLKDLMTDFKKQSLRAPKLPCTLESMTMDNHWFLLFPRHQVVIHLPGHLNEIG